MTGPRIITTSRSRTRQIDGWRRPACRGFGGIIRFHALVAEHTPAQWAKPPAEVASRVFVGIETDRSPWVTALRAAGYRVFAMNLLSASRYRERHVRCQAQRG